jgi:hypothetical protein
LRELTELIRESKKGKWRVILDYDNYQDGARILDGDGTLHGECYELPPEDMDVDDGVAWQFSKALDQAKGSTPCAVCGGNGGAVSEDSGQIPHHCEACDGIGESSPENAIGEARADSATLPKPLTQ